MKQVIDAANAHPGYVKDGKKFLAVKDRVKLFREFYSETIGILTEIIEYGGGIGDKIVIKASIVGPNSFTIATGHAEETRGDGAFNSFAALECAETKAVGRALAFLGLGGGELASLDELQTSLHSQRDRRGDVDVELWSVMGGASGPPSRPGVDAGERQIGMGAGSAGTTGVDFSPAPGPQGDETVDPKLEAWSDIAAYLKMAMTKQPTIRDLNKLYKLNQPLIDEMAKKDPPIHKDLLEAFASAKIILQANQGETNGQIEI